MGSGTDDILKGNWKQLKGKVQQKWGELTNDEIDQMRGERTELAGKLQEKYGKTKNQIEDEIDSFLAENK